MKLPSTHPGQKIPISILYKEVLAFNIGSNEWDDFIKKAFNNPEEYIDMNKLQKRIN